MKCKHLNCACKLRRVSRNQTTKFELASDGRTRGLQICFFSFYPRLSHSSFSRFIPFQIVGIYLGRGGGGGYKPSTQHSPLN